MKYDRLTQYIEIFQPGYSAGTCFFDKEHSGTADDPIQMPFVMFDQNVMKFMDEFYESGKLQVLKMSSLISLICIF